MANRKKTILISSIIECMSEMYNLTLTESKKIVEFYNMSKLIDDNGVYVYHHGPRYWAKEIYEAIEYMSTARHTHTM